MTKNIFIFVLALTLTALCAASASAYFTESHYYWTLDGLNNVNSPITAKCRPYTQQILDGNTLADVPVLHYFDQEFMSYVATHTRGMGFQRCLQLAAGDPALECMCYGIGLHITQDAFAHLTDGIVSKYLDKDFAVNLWGHMVVEKDFQNKHMSLVASTQPVKSGTLQYYNDKVLCTFFEEGKNEICDGIAGGTKYISIAEESFGFQLDGDVQTFQMGYIGKGFYSTVYPNNVQLPGWYWGVSLFCVIVGGAILVLSLKYGVTNWKWLLAVLGTVVLLLGAILLFTVMTGTTWTVINWFIEIPAAVGVLEVNDEDIEYYDSLVKQATYKFLTTGILEYDDVSGLSYEARDGTWVEGPLVVAETKGKALSYLLVAAFMAMIGYVFYKSFYD